MICDNALIEGTIEYRKPRGFKPFLYRGRAAPK